MSKKASLFQTNFSAGEVSEEIEARVDVGKRFNAARTIENCWLLPEGGATRRPGLRYICEVKDSTKFTMAIPFELDVNTAFVLEVGQGYFRFIKNRAQVQLSGSPYELSGSPYQESDLRDIHYEQSQDFIFFCSSNPAIDIQKLAHITDTNWTLGDFNANPPPSFDADENLAVPGAITANTGTVAFRVGSDQFLAGDVGRQIIAGTGRALITGLVNARQLTVDVLDPFAETITAGPATLLSVGTLVTSVGHGAVAGNAVLLTGGAQSGEVRMIIAPVTANTFTIDAAFSVDQAAPVAWSKLSGFASGAWLLRLPPQTTLDVDAKEPVGSQVNIVTGAAALRASYVGKFIKVLGGTIKITSVTGTTTALGTIMSILNDSTTADPAAVPIGAWRLQEASWSSTRGRPRTLCTHQGRLVFASTPAQPKTFWAPSLNDIYNFATGSLADDAYEYTIQGGSQDLIQWLLSLVALYIGDAKSEYSATGQGVNAPIGGNETPTVNKISSAGSMHAQAIVVDNAILLLQRFKRDLVQLSYSLQDSPEAASLAPSEPTLFTRQISEMMFAKHHPTYQAKPNSIVFYGLTNGQLGGLTFKPRQEVLAWSRTVTDGDIESYTVVPHEDGERLTILCIVKRTIDGVTKRYWEYFDDNATELTARGWTTLQTDSAKVGTILAGVNAISGLDHIEGKTVDVIINGSALTPRTVSGGAILLSDAEIPPTDSVYEVGLHYDSTLKTLRPAIPNEITEGLKRNWSLAFVRVKDTIGGHLNGTPLKQPASGRPFSGLLRLENPENPDPYDGALTITQTQPYPMTVLGVAGRVNWGDEMA